MICEKIQKKIFLCKKSEDIPPECEWTRYAGYYPTNSKPWRIIAKTACDIAENKIKEGKTRIFSSLLDHRIQSFKSTPGQVAPHFYNKVRNYELDSQNEKDLNIKKFMEWKLKGAVYQLEREKKTTGRTRNNMNASIVEEVPTLSHQLNKLSDIIKNKNLPSERKQQLINKISYQYIPSIQSKLNKRDQFLKYYKNVVNADDEFFKTPIGHSGNLSSNRRDEDLPDIEKKSIKIHKEYFKYSDMREQSLIPFLTLSNQIYENCIEMSRYNSNHMFLTLLRENDSLSPIIDECSKKSDHYLGCLIFEILKSTEGQ